MKDEVARAFRGIALPSLVAVISLFFSAELTFSQLPATSKKAAKAQIENQFVQPPATMSPLQSPPSAEVNHEVTVTASWSQPVVSAIYYFDWGDQTPVESVTDPSKSHVYTIAGNHTVTVTSRAQLANMQWVSGSKQADIMVNWVPPPAANPPTLSVKPEPSEVVVGTTVRVIASFDSEVSEPRYRFVWDDGSEPTEGSQSWADHTYSSSGPHAVTVVATILFNDRETPLQQTVSVLVNPAASPKIGKKGDDIPRPSWHLRPPHWPPLLRLAMGGLALGLLVAGTGLIWRKVRRTQRRKLLQGELRILGRSGMENHSVAWSEQPGEAWSLTLKPGSNLSQHRITWMDRTESQVGGTDEQRI